MRRRSKNRSANNTKGSLIKGMSQRLPSEILASPVFKERLKQLMRRYAGMYALYRGNKPYYIGLTRNLWGRIRWHLKDRHAGKWDRFINFRIKRVRYLKDIETLMQHVVDTPGNRVKGKVPRDADLSRILREELRVHERAIRGIRRAMRQEL